MAAACDFDAIPRSITSAGSVRFFPRSSGFSLPILSYLWKFGDQYTFTTDFSTSTSQLLFADADDNFAVDDRVMLSTSNTLPNGLSATVLYFIKAVTSTYVTLSLTSGGAAVTFSDDGTGTHKVEHGSANATPIFEYPAVAAVTSYDVYLKVTDANSNTATKTNTDFVTSDLAANVSGIPGDGSYYKVSVLLYDDTNSIIVNRNPWTGSHLYLTNPKIVDSIDRIGVLSFSILDIGDSSATEKSLLAEGVNVAFIRERTVLYSGVVKRCTQSTQNGFDTTNRVRLWDFECDSDLARLGKLKVESSVLAASGAMFYDTPGNLARTILTPAAGERDTRGVINCVDAKIFYQLNSATTTEDVGSRYDHLTIIHGLTNYDMRTRPNFLVYNYNTFDGANIVTINGASFTADEFIGGYLLFVSPTNLDGTVNAKGILSFGKITDNDGTTITCTTITGASVASTTNGQVIIFLGYYVDFAQDLSQPSVVANYDVNKDIIQYSDNDDKRKLSTKIVASGKNLQGVTISVALAGVHAYDNNAQFFEDSTFVTLKTEGDVFSNPYVSTYAPVSVAITRADLADFSPALEFASNYLLDHHALFVSGGTGNFPIGCHISVTLTGEGAILPTPLVINKDYYVSGGSDDRIYLTELLGDVGDASHYITITDDGYPEYFIQFPYGYFSFDNTITQFLEGQIVTLVSDTAPTYELIDETPGTMSNLTLWYAIGVNPYGCYLKRVL